jgi:hypothetical protein
VLTESEIIIEFHLKNQKGHILESDFYLIYNYGGKTIYDILKSVTLIKISENQHVTMYTCKKNKK